MTEHQDNGIPIAEAARRLNISQELIRKRIYRKRLSGYKVDGKWFVVLPGHDQTGQQEPKNQPEEQDKRQDAMHETRQDSQDNPRSEKVPAAALPLGCAHTLSRGERNQTGSNEKAEVLLDRCEFPRSGSAG